MDIKTDFSKHLFRPSQMGKIMTGVDKIGLTANQEKMYGDYLLRFQGEGRPLTPNQVNVFHDLGKKKTEKPKLSTTAQNELKKMHTGLVYNRSKLIQTLAMEKGIIAEDKSISLDAYAVDKLLIKNRERRKNDWFNGECDNAQGIIREYKSSWDFETFPLHKDEARKDYEYQGNCYMDLWDLDVCEVVHCLVDTPAEIIKKDLYNKMFRYDYIDDYGNIKEDKIGLVVELISNHIYTTKGLEEYCAFDDNVDIQWFYECENPFIEIPEEIRRKVYRFERDDILIDSMKKQIVLAREYLGELSQQMIEEMNLKLEEVA